MSVSWVLARKPPEIARRPFLQVAVAVPVAGSGATLVVAEAVLSLPPFFWQLTCPVSVPPAEPKL